MPNLTKSNPVASYDAEYAHFAALRGGTNAHPVPNVSPSNDDSPALLRVLVKRRKALALCVVAALCCASLASMLFRSVSWKESMIVNYTPTNNGNLGIVSPTATTLVSFLKAPRIEETMRSEFPDFDFGERFEEAVEVKVPYGTQAVEIELSSSDNSHAEAFREWVAQFFRLNTWSKPPRFIDDWNRRFEAADIQVITAKQESENVLNRLKAVFAESVAEHWRETIKSRLADQRAALDEWTAKLKIYHEELADFNKQNNLQDLKTETNKLITDVTLWETKLEEARLAKTSSDKIKEAIRLQKEKRNPAAGDNDSKKSTDAEPNVALTPQLQIERELRRNDVDRIRAELKQAKKQFEYDTRLFEKQFISEAVYAQKKLAIESLEDQLARAERIWQLGLQVETLPAGVAAESIHMVDYIEAILESKRKDLARLQSLSEQAEHLENQVTIATEARKQVSTRVNELETLEKSNLEEDFQDIRPATLDVKSVKSTGKKWFLVSFVLCCLLFGSPVIARDLLPRRKRGAEAQAEQLGIPVLVHDAVLPTSQTQALVAPDESDERSRLLALRIQQSVPRTEEGAVVLFSGLEQSANVSQLTKLANCWARRGERVLLLDSGDDEEVQVKLTGLLSAAQVTLEHQSKDAIANGQSSKKQEFKNGLPVAKAKNGLPQVAVTGLTDFLQDDSIESQSLIQKTEIKGVDCVMAGKLPMPAEGLASHRMTEFLHAMRKQYSLIVLMGPSTSRPVDLELLASRADGIVFSTDGSREVSPRSHAVVKNLIELNAPVLGVIS